MSQDNEILKICRIELDEKLLNADSDSFFNFNFQILSSIIAHETGSHLLPSSLKRFFEVTDDFNADLSLSIETKNIICKYLGHENWAKFVVICIKKYNLKIEKVQESNLDIEDIPFTDHHKSYNIIRFVFLPLLCLFLIFSSIYFFLNYKNQIKSKDDIFGLVASSDTIKEKCFYFRKPLNDNKYSISFGDGEYYFPTQSEECIKHTYNIGVHRAKLFLGDSTVKIQGVVIPTKGWQVEFSNVKIKEKIKIFDPLVDDFHFSADQVANYGVSDTSYFLTVFRYFKVFNIDLDNFSAEISIKNDSLNGGSNNSKVGAFLYGSTEKIHIEFANNKSKSLPTCKISNLHLDSKNNLSIPFVKDFTTYKTIKIKTKNSKIIIFVDNELIFESNYKDPIGKMYGICLMFAKSGFANSIKLFDTNDRLVYSFNGKEKT